MEHIPNKDFEEDPSFFHAEESETEQPDEDSFPPQMEQAVMGLMFIGKLTKEFNLWGHTFSIKTLTAGEELAIAQVTREYENTLGQGKAMATATVAACIELVDGAPLIGALGPDVVATIRQRFEYVRDKWYWPTVEAVFTQYSELQLRQAMAYDALESKSQASLATF